jgi:hypothetical protein
MEFLSYLYLPLLENTAQTEDVGEVPAPAQSTTISERSQEQELDSMIDSDRAEQMYPTLYF